MRLQSLKVRLESNFEARLVFLSELEIEDILLKVFLDLIVVAIDIC